MPDELSAADTATAPTESAPPTEAADTTVPAADPAPITTPEAEAAPAAAAQADPGSAPSQPPSAAPLSDNLTPEEIQQLRDLRTEMQKLGKDATSYKGVLSLANRHARSANEARAQLEALQAQAQQREAQQRQEAEQAKLRLWHKKHPDHNRFQSLLQRSRDDEARLAAIPRDSEAFQVLAEAIGKQWSTEDRQLLHDWGNHLEAQKQAVLADPEGYVSDLLERQMPHLFQQKMQEWEAYRAAQQGAQQFLDSNKELVDARGAELRELMAEGLSANRALEVVRMKAELEALKGRRSQDAETVARSQAHLKATEATATVRRDSQTVELKEDPVASLQKKGLTGHALNLELIRASRQR